jgi:hypothetical protein
MKGRPSWLISSYKASSALKRLARAAQTALTSSSFTAFSASGTTPQNQLTFQMTLEFFNALLPRIENDELCGLAPLKITTTSGLLPLLKFTGDGGDYRVQFKTQ